MESIPCVENKRNGMNSVLQGSAHGASDPGCDGLGRGQELGRDWYESCKPLKKKNNQPRPEAVVLGRPPEGADYVRLPPLGAWSWSGPSFLPGTGRGFSVDDDFQAYPLSCESLPKP